MKLLVTGAAGLVGTMIRPHLAEQYSHVLLTDIEPVADLEENESFEKGDLADFDFINGLASKCDGILHLGGMVGAAYTFEEIIGPNYIGTHNVFTAACRNGISNVVYASSHHAVGFIRRGEPIDEKTPHRPDSEYAVSKAFGESAASFFVDNFGINILSIRIGYVGTEVEFERRLHTWISPRDLAQLVGIGLTTENLEHEIVYGVSDVEEPFFDNSNATRLGYKPKDRAVDFVTSPDVLKTAPDLSEVAEGVVGGGFAAVGFEGNTERLLGK